MSQPIMSVGTPMFRREVESSCFSEETKNDMVIYRLRVKNKIVCTAELMERCQLLKIWSNPRCRGFGTKMLEYIEQTALESACRKMTVLYIKNDERATRFFERRGYKLGPDPQIPSGFTGEKSLAHFLPLVGDIRSILGF